MIRILFAVTLTAIFFCLGCMSEAKEVQKDIIDDKKQFSRQDLIIYSSPEKYSYENLLHDVEILKKNYPTQIKVLKLCETADGRGVFDIILGDIDGENQILIFGAMHAREYITIQVVMRQLCESLDAINGNGEFYRDVPAAELLQGLTIHFVPNSNPDGVAISQFGLSAVNNPAIRAQIAEMSSDFEQCFPGSEPEAAALISLTKNYHIKRAISYHTCGALIYWYYKQSGNVLAESQKFAEEIAQTTGYYLDDDYTSVDAAGYKDWAVYKIGVPSITIEVGTENGEYINPVPQSQFNTIWSRNKNVIYTTAYNLKFE